MSYELNSVHKHNIIFSYAESKNDKNNYEIKDILILKNGMLIYIPKNNFCFFKCYECNNLLLPRNDETISVQIEQLKDLNRFQELKESLGTNTINYYKLSNNDKSNKIFIGDEEEIGKISKKFKINDKMIKQMENFILKNKDQRIIKENDLKIQSLKNENYILKKQNEKLNRLNEKLGDQFFKLMIMSNNNSKNILDIPKEKETYDIVVDITSFFDLILNGWKIKYPRGKEEYERKKKWNQ